VLIYPSTKKNDACRGEQPRGARWAGSGSPQLRRHNRLISGGSSTRVARGNRKRLGDRSARKKRPYSTQSHRRHTNLEKGEGRAHLVLKKRKRSKKICGNTLRCRMGSASKPGGEVQKIGVFLTHQDIVHVDKRGFAAAKEKKSGVGSGHLAELLSSKVGSEILGNWSRASRQKVKMSVENFGQEKGP